MEMCKTLRSNLHSLVADEDMVSINPQDHHRSRSNCKYLRREKPEAAVRTQAQRLLPTKAIEMLKVLVIFSERGNITRSKSKATMPTASIATATTNIDCCNGRSRASWRIKDGRGPAPRAVDPGRSHRNAQRRHMIPARKAD